MVKKYLLYIHHPKFGEEAKKSELVNTLLNDWYGQTKNPKNPYKAPIIEPKENTLLSDKTVAEVLPKLVEKACKHGYPPMFCRFAKNGKPCK